MIEIKHKITGKVIYTYAGDSLRGANLRGADLLYADLRGADLRYAKLSGADLLGADLRGAKLFGADLRDAKLYGADLRGADLRGADLRDAKLYGANLRGANLSGADLLGADLGGACLSDSDFSDADLRGAFLRGTYLSAAKLPGANLGEAQTDQRFITIGCIGSSKRQTTYCFDTDTVWCGCFTGTLKEFSETVEKTHKNNPQYLKEYRGAIAYIKRLRSPVHNKTAKISLSLIGLSWLFSAVVATGESFGPGAETTRIIAIVGFVISTYVGYRLFKRIYR